MDAAPTTATKAGIGPTIVKASVTKARAAFVKTAPTEAAKTATSETAEATVEATKTAAERDCTLGPDRKQCGRRHTRQ